MWCATGHPCADSKDSAASCTTDQGKVYKLTHMCCSCFTVHIHMPTARPAELLLPLAACAAKA